jgi:hypothetical protein
MTKNTTVELTQAGRRITFSAGYIVGVSPHAVSALGPTGEHIHFGCGIITQLGVACVDQETGEAMLRWQMALAAPDSDPPRFYYPRAPLASRLLGNDAEF